MPGKARPTVSLHRADGRSMLLEHPRPGAELALIHGAEGVGIGPVDLSTAPRLVGHGSVLRGSRVNEREIFLPVLARSTTVEGLAGVRAQLMRFLSPLDKTELTVRVQAPGIDRWREIPVVYSAGLSGDFGEGYRGTSQRIGLTFKASDALWRGEPLFVPSRQLDGAVKPFLSTTVPFFPIQLAASTVAGQIVLDMDGDAPTRPIWTVTPPGSDLRIRHAESGAQFGVDGLLTEPIVIDMTRRGPYVAATGERLWKRVPIDKGQLFELTPGRNTVEFSMVGSTPDSSVELRYSPRFLAGY